MQVRPAVGPGTLYALESAESNEYGYDHQHRHAFHDLIPMGRYDYGVSNDDGEHVGYFRPPLYCRMGPPKLPLRKKWRRSGMIQQEIKDDARPYLKRLEDERIVIWGAGLHGCWLMRAAGENGIAFIDSNPTKQGTAIEGRPVIAPEALGSLDFDRLWIAVLSDVESIAHTLQEMGLEEGRNYEVIFKNGKLIQFLESYGRYVAFLRDFEFTGRTVLEVGYGGQLFSALILLNLGASSVTLTDVVAYPHDIVEKYGSQYCEFLRILRAEHPDCALCLDDYDQLIKRVQIVHAPHSATALPYGERSFDCIYSTGVMEHVSAPETAIAEFARILRPTGLALNLGIGIHDHRANNPQSGYHPWSFLEYSEEEWHAFDANPYHQNRWRAIDFRRAFEDRGFDILKYETQLNDSLTDAQRARFDPRFADYSLRELCEMSLFLAAAKRA